MSRKQRLLVLSALIMTIVLVVSLSSSETPAFAIANTNKDSSSAADLLSQFSASNGKKGESPEIKTGEKVGSPSGAGSSSGSVGLTKGSSAGSTKGSSSDSSTGFKDLQDTHDSKDAADAKAKPLTGSKAETGFKDLQDSRGSDLEGSTQDEEAPGVADAGKLSKDLSDPAEVVGSKGATKPAKGSSDHTGPHGSGNILKDSADALVDDADGGVDSGASKKPAKTLKSSAGTDDEDEDSSVFDPAKEYNDIMSMGPVVIFSKTGCPYSRALKDLLNTNYDIVPAPTIVELDLHTHGRELQNYLGETSGRKTVPNFFVNGVSRGGSDEIKTLHAAGTLLSELKTWGGKLVQVSKLAAPSNQ
ncbi:unnamed protein product [Kuraishia capsulata CBS 1993]|uniref:Glutaredoxin domain-containing protein n=1 Tax=Kuraishia capsulata CBS 1993 TaxID=1382522 RepID=W6MM30_9ASCO|nr:uncharacterized protein KUCA_T00003572001 [Kuraishia capsulata CBS 1993]CDK27594.1 unnamed protein product [Kuraishia capsulata CBS 1993]